MRAGRLLSYSVWPNALLRLAAAVLYPRHASRQPARPFLVPHIAARLYCTAGVHPTRCGEIEAAPEGAAAYWEALRGVLEEGKREGKTVAVGECGLDGDR